MPIERLEMRNQHLVDKYLLVGDKKEEDIFYASTLENCTLEIVRPDRVMLYRSLFRRCIFKAKKKVNVVWTDCAWYDCTFFGHYFSMPFGSMLDTPNEQNPWGKYLVHGCDFSEAKVHGCWFTNTEIDSMKFPRWPCFTMLDPSNNFEKWEATLNTIQHRLFGGRFATKGVLDAEVFHWPTLARHYKIDADPEEVRKKLNSLDDVLL